MNLRTKIGVVAVLLSTLTVQAQNIPFRKAEIKETMKKVADWQIANPNKGAEHGDLSWTNAVLYVGMLDWAELAEREDVTRIILNGSPVSEAVTAGSRTSGCIMPTTSLFHNSLSTFTGNIRTNICSILPLPARIG